MLPTESINTDRYSPAAVSLITELEKRLDDILAEVKREEFWSKLNSADTSPAQIGRIFREVYQAICWYQPRTTEASFHMIGRLPKHEITLMKSTVLHRVEEAEHGEWAVRDFVLLGGDEKQARTSDPSPATFAVAAVWWRMAQLENPFGYYGAEYLFEYLTAKIAIELVELFKSRGVDSSKVRFIIEHATEDVKHATLFRHLICDVVTRYPESREAMLRCFDYFRAVYPLPVWREAYARAITAKVP